MTVRTVTFLAGAALLAALGACTDRQEQRHEMEIAEPDPVLDPTREQVREPLRRGIEPPPEHRQPLEFVDEEERAAEERRQRRIDEIDPRALEGPPEVTTEQPLPVDAPIPHAQDDRPEGIDPTEEPLIDPVGEPVEPEPEPEPGQRGR
jgi:hypothetical protein